MRLFYVLWLWTAYRLPCHGSPTPMPPSDGASTRDAAADRNRESTQDFYTSRQYVVQRNLVRTWMQTMDSLQVETWLMHSALLGWWRNKKLLPWDTSTISVQLAEPDLFFLAAYHNTSAFHFWSRDVGGRKRGKRSRYLLHISPDATDREPASQAPSLADARWVDTATGASLDVYAVRYGLGGPAIRGRRRGVWWSRDGGEVMASSLFPLLSATFEGVPVKIPSGYRNLLEEEYGPEAFRRTEQRGQSNMHSRGSDMTANAKDESGPDHDRDL
ncbi:hypothetical protein VTJ83DRAFT_642 [Remersonia thermophila]|uniref:LicD/FKTN/FKRP nucleotidyltransferase domain-containing protein n=1 Tax=Remersonia thermophila TaxID=72144 RepID=A0ABR4DLX6_9PEZI